LLCLPEKDKRISGVSDKHSKVHVPWPRTKPAAEEKDIFLLQLVLDFLNLEANPNPENFLFLFVDHSIFL